MWCRSSRDARRSRWTSRPATISPSWSRPPRSCCRSDAAGMGRYTEARVNAIPDNTQGRVDYLRLSITDRCNLRCTYCMPPEGVPARSHDDILSYEELAAFARVAAACGISKVRITGGEPLVRHGCADFVGMLSRASGIHDISLTTNGLLLPRYAADLRRVSGQKQPVGGQRDVVDAAGAAEHADKVGAAVPHE